MHNVSKQQIQELAKHFAEVCSTKDTTYLLEKARELYEKVIVLHYDTPLENRVEPIDEVFNENIEIKLSDSSDISLEIEEKELSVQERIQQIMNAAPKFEPSSDSNVTVNDESEKLPKTTAIDKAFEITQPSYSVPEEVKKPLPTNISLEEELKDAISADYAADLFENAEKIEITKKSLNDKLSQVQLQIGLNDRIAFVKHLFDGSQAEFNRVLSQLNSFQSEPQAKHFIETMVKPDYNWESKTDYEERFMILIERKFL